MVCRIEQSEQQPEANAPAPAPQRVTYREYSPEGGVAEAPLAARTAQFEKGMVSAPDPRAAEAEPAAVVL